MKALLKYLLPISIVACNSSDKSESGNADGLGAFSADSLAAHIQVLASDEFEGRKPFSPGETKTINYLSEQFKALGLEPGNGDSYFQEVPMVKITTAAAPTMEVKSGKGNFSLKGFEDYVIWTDKTDSTVTLNNTELVFAGYGVVAPEYNWNDYAGLDVKGKVVLVMVNDPGFRGTDSSLFRGKSMTYYGRWTYKFEEAARQGAKGCLIIHNTEGASYPFAVVQNSWNTSRLRLDNRGKSESLCDVIGWVSGTTASKLLATKGLDSTLYMTADQRGFKGQPLGVTLTTSMKVMPEYSKSHNVIGKITGATKPDETIIYSAHWDHLGIGKPDEKGDSIYNGALDNATGAAGLLELARAHKSSSVKPAHTIVFLAVTAEEQGLWGSAWYAQNPVYPASKTLANINMDVLNWYGKTKDIIVVGQGQSELEDIIREEAEKSGRVIAYESKPEAGYYYRSDHFNFAKAGIPALYINHGTEVEGKGKEFGKKLLDEYETKNYHRPSDQYNAAEWKLDGAIEDLKLVFQVARRIDAAKEMPRWKEGSEFKAIRDKQKLN